MVRRSGGRLRTELGTGSERTKFEWLKAVSGVSSSVATKDVTIVATYAFLRRFILSFGDGPKDSTKFEIMIF